MRHHHRYVFGMLILLLSALQLPSPAAPAYPWIAFKFDVYKGCQPLSRTELLYFQYGAKQIAAVFASRLGHRVRKAEPIRFRLICDEKLFYKFQEQHFGRVVGGGYHFKSGEKYEIHMLYRAGDKDLSKGILHEMTHHVMHMRVGDQQPSFPFWFNEGMAGYFGNAQPTMHSLRVVISYRDETISKWVADYRYPTLKTFFKLTPAQWSSWKYTRDISESLFHFLMESSQGNRVVAELLKAGYAHQNIETTLAKIYPGGLDRLQYDWTEWLHYPRKEHVWADLP